MNYSRYPRPLSAIQAVPRVTMVSRTFSFSAAYSTYSPSGVLGRNHKETWAGCIVSLTTPTRSSFSASRSVSSRSLEEGAASGRRVKCAYSS